MKTFLSLILATGLLFSGFLDFGGVRTEDVMITSYPSPDETFLSATALVAMRHIVQARADIHAKNLSHARDELNQALSLLDIIEAMDPAYRIRIRIWAAGKRLSYEKVVTIIGDLTDLYNSVDAIEEQVRRESAREHIGKAKKYVESGNRKSAGTELVLADEALMGTEIDLPVRYTRARVEEARELLRKKKPEQADAALKSAEDGIRFLSVADYTNVVRARKSLSSAFKNYTTGKLEAAGADLKEARAYLEKEAQSAGIATRTEAAALAKEVESVEGKVGKWDKETSREIRNLYLKAKALAVKAAGVFETRKNKSG
jgi:hypothetical protein